MFSYVKYQKNVSVHVHEGLVLVRCSQRFRWCRVERFLFNEPTEASVLWGFQRVLFPAFKCKVFVVFAWLYRFFTVTQSNWHYKCFTITQINWHYTCFTMIWINIKYVPRWWGSVMKLYETVHYRESQIILPVSFTTCAGYLKSMMTPRCVCESTDLTHTNTPASACLWAAVKLGTVTSDLHASV